MTEFRPRGFLHIPPIIKNIIIINLLVFLAQQTLGARIEQELINMFALHDVSSYFFRPHQLITYLFLHGSWGHVLMNMFVLWMFGSILEDYWGPKRFLTFYIVCGIGAAVAQLAVQHMDMADVWREIHSMPLSADDREALKLPNVLFGGQAINAPTLGASGAVFGCMAAFGYLFPNNELLIIPIPFPIKAKWLVLGYAAIELFAGLEPSQSDNVAHWAHLGGGLIGLLLVIYWNRNNRRNFY
ncbi:MAG TPA: rhomboid family intramembrane serine protease [Puia sp.]|nr:rhomboid family intramembrane serine protease [Puia sp.]